LACNFSVSSSELHPHSRSSQHDDQAVLYYRTGEYQVFRIKPRIAGWAALALAGPCCAHHSFAMFDRTKTVTLEGTVKQFQWTNPHCFIQILVPSDSGPVERSIEMNSPGASYREGWRPGSLKAGDRVTLVINPVRDDAHGGRLVSATDSGGRTLNQVRSRR
jgi:hypothetical protein